MIKGRTDATSSQGMFPIGNGPIKSINFKNKSLYHASYKG